jgi:hypothetical protein
VLQLKQWLGFRTIEEQRAAEEQARMTQKRAKTSSHGSAGAARGNKGNNGKSTIKNNDSAAQEESSEDDDNSSAGEGSEEQEGSPYQRDPALGELLQFVLSLPYVDEMWGIHDLILVSPASYVAWFYHMFTMECCPVIGAVRTLFPYDSVRIIVSGFDALWSVL